MNDSVLTIAISGLRPAVLMACVCGTAALAQAAEVQVIRGPATPDPGKLQPGELNAPFAVDFDREGRMVIVEYDGGRVLRLTADGDLQHLAGDGNVGYVDGAATKAQFNKLHNLAIAADGRMYLSDHLNHAVRCYDPSSQTVTTVAGDGTEGFRGDGGPARQARFRQPICVTLAPDGNSLLVADIGNRRIRQISLQKQTIETIVGIGEKGTPEDGTPADYAPLVDPRAVAAAPDGSLYILERGGHALRVVRRGRVHTVAGTGRAGHTDGDALQSQLNGPKHMDVAPDGRVFIADDNNHAIRCYDPRARTLSTVDLGDYRLNRPHGVRVHDDQLYIADSYHHRILRTPLP